MQRIGETLPRWLASLKARLDAGELVTTEDSEQWHRDEERRQREERERQWSIQELFLSARHIEDARRTASQPSQIRRKLAEYLSGHPGASVLLVGDAGCGKTTAATAYALRQIRNGWTVRHRQASRFDEVARNTALRDELHRVDLLILDELANEVAAWVMSEIRGVIDERYQRRRQTIGCITAPDPMAVLGREVVERFDARLISSEGSLRRRG